MTVFARHVVNDKWSYHYIFTLAQKDYYSTNTVEEKSAQSEKPSPMENGLLTLHT